MYDAEPIPEGESAVYKKLHQELVRRGVSGFRFHRVPGPYYEKPLEFRAERLNAPSVHHLCKTMVMENTRAPEELQKIDDPRASKYFMVLVQYTASIDTNKLGQWVHKVRNTLALLYTEIKCQKQCIIGIGDLVVLARTAGTLSCSVLSRHDHCVAYR